MNAGSGFTAFNFPDPRVARERITINSKPSSKGACTVVTSAAELLSTQKDRPPSYRPTDPYCPIRPRRPVSADQARTPLRPVHADRRVTALADLLCGLRGSERMAWYPSRRPHSKRLRRIGGYDAARAVAEMIERATFAGPNLQLAVIAAARLRSSLRADRENGGRRPRCQAISAARRCRASDFGSRARRNPKRSIVIKPAPVAAARLRRLRSTATDRTLPKGLTMSPGRCDSAAHLSVSPIK